MNAIARGFLYLVVVMFCFIGGAALFQPEFVAANLGLSIQSVKGVDEVRGIVGGGFISWGLLTLGGLHCKPFSSGFLIAMATMMGSIAATRVVSMIVDQDIAYAFFAFIGEVLIALACWTVYKHDKASRAAA